MHEEGNSSVCVVVNIVESECKVGCVQLPANRGLPIKQGVKSDLSVQGSRRIMLVGQGKS